MGGKTRCSIRVGTNDMKISRNEHIREVPRHKVNGLDEESDWLYLELCRKRRDKAPE